MHIGFKLISTKPTARLCVGCVPALDIRTRLSRPLQIESTQAESQWIVGQAYSQHLQYLEAIKSSAKDLSLPIFEIAIDLTVRMKLGRSLYLSCNKGRGV